MVSEFIQLYYLLFITVIIVVGIFTFISSFVSSLGIRLIPDQLRFTESKKDILVDLYFY